MISILFSNLLVAVIYFDVQRDPDLASGSLFKFSPVSFRYVTIILWAFPPFQYNEVFQAHLVFSLPQLCNHSHLWRVAIPFICEKYL